MQEPVSEGAPQEVATESEVFARSNSFRAKVMEEHNASCAWRAPSAEGHVRE